MKRNRCAHCGNPWLPPADERTSDLRLHWRRGGKWLGLRGWRRVLYALATTVDRKIAGGDW